MIELLKNSVSAGKLGGWVRAGVASGLSLLILHVPVVKDILDPATQTAISVAIAGVAVGLWSHYVKS